MTQHNATRAENAVALNWSITQVAGEPIGVLDWRFRGVNLGLASWTAAERGDDDTFRVPGEVKLSRAPFASEERLVDREMGLEVFFDWKGQGRHLLRRFRLSRGDNNLWDIGVEINEPIRWSGPREID